MKNLTYRELAEIRAAQCGAACQGVTFEGDPDGAVKALVEAAQLVLVLGHHAGCKTQITLDIVDCTCTVGRSVWSRPLRAALARVRVATDGDADEEGGTK